MLTFPDFKEKQIVFIHGSHKKKVQFANENLVLYSLDTNKIQNRVSCHKIFALFILGDISLTSVLLRKASLYGFTVILMNRNFRTYCVLGGQTEGNFLLRKQQYDCSNELEISRHIVKNKIFNQRNLLKKIRSKDIEKDAIQILMRYEKLSEESNGEKELLGIEGYCSKVFFQAYFKDLNWKARRPRTKCDVINFLMDMGYTYLFNFIESHLRLYGFDLYMGIYHKRFYERKSLVCDLVEPFRCIIDKAIRKAYGLKTISHDDFFVSNGQYILKRKKNEKYTSLFIESIMDFREDMFQYIQGYYRSFVRNQPVEKFPFFEI